MDRLPQRISLVAQTADLLRESIASGKWERWLPGELELARRFHVSRLTIRNALAELERDQLIRSGQGRRREILPRSQKPPRAAAHRSVALLCPLPLHRLPSSTVFWIDELREHLGAAGWLLEVVESAAAYSRRPARALGELSTRIRPGAWVLYRSTAEMQHWFNQHAPRAIIAGSRHPEVSLSSVDVDYFAASRHAAGKLVAVGHQQLAIVRPDSKLAGDLQSVAGFESGAKRPIKDALHDGTVTGICRSLDRLFAQPAKPTGLFVFHADQLLTVLGWLYQHQLRIPRDVSVLCRDDEPFLEAVIPTPCRYSVKARLFAQRISRLVADLVGSHSGPAKQQKIIPEFIPGDTLACPSK